jgi:hypothetical protein
MEDFFETLKREAVYLYEYEKVYDVMVKLYYFIEEGYNHERLH